MGQQGVWRQQQQEQELQGAAAAQGRRPTQGEFPHVYLGGL